MTYGFLPDNWPAFKAELERRGIATADIEKVEIRPNADAKCRSGGSPEVCRRHGDHAVWSRRIVETASRGSLTIPPSLLLRADQIIE